MQLAWQAGMAASRQPARCAPAVGGGMGGPCHMSPHSHRGRPGSQQLIPDGTLGLARGVLAQYEGSQPTG
eukprot:COSAG01_NODE_24577_length_774_cov_0.954074_1_plen_69_part_10